MATKTKTSVKSFFETGDKPTEAQFEHLIDSYLDYDATLHAIATAAQGGKTGLLLINGTAAVSGISLGAVGNTLIQVVTTASAQGHLGFTNVGTKVVESSTTASAQTAIGLSIGAVGAQIISVATTASANSIIAGQVQSGQTVQVVNTQTGAVATGTTLIPTDDTIPQNTEGIEFMTRSITPTNASNTLLVDVVFIGSHSVAANLTAALFQDSTANALACGVYVAPSSNQMVTIAFRHKMTAGTTSATTFKVRAGANNAGTTTFNGSGGNRQYGGVFASSITITEIKV